MYSTKNNILRIILYYRSVAHVYIRPFSKLRRFPLRRPLANRRMIGGRDGVMCMRAMLDWHCCPRCALRYTAVINEKIYAKPLQAIHKHIKQLAENLNQSETNDESHDIEIPEYSDRVCVACLGILQDHFSCPSFHKQIVEEKVKAGHDVTTFFLPISFPVTMQLRHHSLCVALSDTFPDLFDKDILETVVTVKEVWRWLNLKPLGTALNLTYDTDSAFLIKVNFSHTSSQKECRFLYSACGEFFKKRKRSGDVFNLSNVRHAICKLSDDTFKQHYQTPPCVLDQPCDCTNVQFHHESLYLAGRYNKYSRTLSQTEWVIDGERKTATSIEELIGGPVNEHVRGDRSVFTSSGREDVDVKMLGTGRPFALECINPRTITIAQQTINQIQQNINSATKDVSVRHLQMVSKDCLSSIKDGELEKVKCYSAVCWSERTITEQDLQLLSSFAELELQQKTPVRVLHRRSLAIRIKTIHSIRAEPINDHHFMLYLNTQAGTYIKEFVHGDMGRTVPNVGAILNTKCDILELNVEAVLLDWPKPIDD